MLKAFFRGEYAPLIVPLLVVLLISLFALSIIGFSCSPSENDSDHGKTEHAERSNSSAANKPNIGNEDSPFTKVVKAIYQSVKTNHESKASNKKQNWWSKFFCETKIGDFALGLFTLWLVLIGGWQGYHLKRTVEATREAAEAIPKIERAYVFLDSVNEIGRDTVSAIRNQAGPIVSTIRLTVRFTFKNHGKTPAILREIFGDPKLCNDISEAIGARGTPITPGQVIGAGDTKTFFTQEFKFSSAEYQAAKETGAPKLFFFGVIHYDDVLRKPRFTEFCWRFDFERSEFRPTLDPDRNKWT